MIFIISKMLINMILIILDDDIQ